MVDSQPLSFRHFESAHRGAVSRPARPDHPRMIPAGSDFTLARGKIPSQRNALKNVRGSNEGLKAGRKTCPLGQLQIRGFQKRKAATRLA